MTSENRYKDALAHPIFEYISKAAFNLNVETYVIGGFVRDYFLKRGTPKDIDIVAIGSGIDLAQAVAKILPNNPKVQVFKTYGTAMLRYNDIEVEFVGARKESYNEASRNDKHGYLHTRIRGQWYDLAKFDELTVLLAYCIGTRLSAN